MVTRRAIFQKPLVLGSLTIACGLFAARILAAFHQGEHAAPQLASENTQSPTPPHPLILQESDGEHRVGRPPFSGFRFTIKVDGQNGNAEDFLAATELRAPGEAIPFHMHHNAEEILILEEGGATVTVDDKRAVTGPRSIIFIPRETWVSVAFTGTQPVHLYTLFSRQGFEERVRAATVAEGQLATPLSADERARLRSLGHLIYWDTSQGPYPPGVAQSAPQSSSEATRSLASAHPLILQANDGEHLLRRPVGQTRPGAPGSIPEFIIKVDKQNGGAEDFVMLTEDLNPGAIINFHKHHNAEEVLILEEGGATVTVGDKRALAGPHAVVFIPRETWVSVTNTANHPIHLYGLFSRPGFEEYLRARSVHPGEPLAPQSPEELHQAAEHGHCTFWDVSKGPYPPGVPHP